MQEFAVSFKLLSLCFRGLGKLFDNSNAKNDVPAGSRVEAPLWLALILSQRRIAALRSFTEPAPTARRRTRQSGILRKSKPCQHVAKIGASSVDIKAQFFPQNAEVL